MFLYTMRPGAPQIFLFFQASVLWDYISSDPLVIFTEKIFGVLYLLLLHGVGIQNNCYGTLQRSFYRHV